MPIIPVDFPTSFPVTSPTVNLVNQLAVAPAKRLAGKAKSPRLETEQILQTFLELVKIDSPSGKEENVRAYLEKRLATYGITKLENLDSNKPGYIVDVTGNLIVKLPSNVGSKRTVLVDTHMDVVPPCIGIKPIIKRDDKSKGETRVVYSSGKTILGGDDKSAIAPLLEALAYSLKTNQPRPNLLLMFTVEEEIGGAGAAKIDPALYTKGNNKADIAISFDISGEQGTVVYQSSQLSLWNATVTGKSAHAGMEPEKGINALKTAALAVANLKVGRLDADTTANVGTFQSGEKFNVIPATAKLTGEARSFTPARVNEELKKVDLAFANVTQSVPGTTYKFEHRTLIEAFKTDLSLAPLTPLRAAMKATGLPFIPIRSNGGSDANVFAKYGVPSVVLSGAYANPHQTSEYVRVQDMVTEAKLMLNIWKQYATFR